MRFTMDELVMTAAATTVVLLVAYVVQRLQHRQTFRVTRLSESEFRVTFEQPTTEQVAQVAHAILRELGWMDGREEAGVAPVLRMPDERRAGRRRHRRVG
jgi:hypothetical protein